MSKFKQAVQKAKESNQQDVKLSKEEQYKLSPLDLFIEQFKKEASVDQNPAIEVANVSVLSRKLPSNTRITAFDGPFFGTRTGQIFSVMDQNFCFNQDEKYPIQRIRHISQFQFLFIQKNALFLFSGKNQAKSLFANVSSLDSLAFPSFVLIVLIQDSKLVLCKLNAETQDLAQLTFFDLKTSLKLAILNQSTIFTVSQNNVVFAIDWTISQFAFRRHFQHEVERLILVNDKIILVSNQIFSIKLENGQFGADLVRDFKFGNIKGVFALDGCVVVNREREILIYSDETFGQLVKVLEFEGQVVAWRCGSQMAVVSSGVLEVV